MTTDLSEIRQASAEVRAWINERPPTRGEALLLLDSIDTLIGIVALSDMRLAVAHNDLEGVASCMETLAVLLDDETMAALRESLASPAP